MTTLKRLVVGGLLLAACWLGGCAHHCHNDLDVTVARGHYWQLCPGKRGFWFPPIAAVGLTVGTMRRTYGVCTGDCCADFHADPRAGAAPCSCTKECPCYSGEIYR